MSDGNRSKRGTITTARCLHEEEIDGETVKSTDCGFFIVREDGLRILKTEYGTEGAALQAGKIIAKSLGIDLTPIKRQVNKREIKP